MTKKYESVLSESERNRICIQASAGKQGLQSDRSVSRATEQAVLAKLQPQLDAIGAGGVSGQSVMKTRTPEGYKLVPIDMLKDALTRVEDVLYKAYNNAQQECCGKGYGGECCGNAVIVWSEDDEEIMDKLSPVQKSITEILSAAPTPDTE